MRAGSLIPAMTFSQLRAAVAFSLLLAVTHYVSTSLAQFTGACRRPEDKLIKETLSDPTARCNDGSQAIFYRRNCTGTSSCNPDRWVIFLEGGELCAMNSTCTRRAQTVPYQTSSEHSVGGRPFYASELCGRTVLDPWPEANPSLHNWTHVYVPYCSSDLHMGRGGRLGSFEFNGYYIIKAIIRQLVDKHGLRNETRTRILFAGKLWAHSCLSQSKAVVPRVGCMRHRARGVLC